MPEGFVDLRSDTVTRPTDEMRRAMATAEVGDDVYGEDPTVNALQDAFAARVGKQAALFVPSGTMGNQLALRLLATPGDLVLAGARQHVVIYESGAGARNAGVQFHELADDDGTLDPADVADAVASRPTPPPRGRRGLHREHPHAGRRRAVAARAARRGCRRGGRPTTVHMDGARLFNAEVATGIGAADYAAPATTVMCCLSKGLCAPVGSLLAGPADVIAAGARRAAAARRRHAAGRRASPPPGWSPYGRWSSAWPTTTPAPAAWPMPSPSGGPTAAATRRESRRTSSCSATAIPARCSTTSAAKASSPARSRRASCASSPITTSTTTASSGPPRPLASSPTGS